MYKEPDLGETRRSPALAGKSRDAFSLGTFFGRKIKYLIAINIWHVCSELSMLSQKPFKMLWF